MLLTLNPAELPESEALNSALLPHDVRQEAALRSFPLRPQGDPMGALNRTYMIHDNTIEGYEGFDFQNPYAFAGGLLQITPTLVPGYGVIGDTRQSVYRNIAAGQGLLGPGGT